MFRTSNLRRLSPSPNGAAETAKLDAVFFALSDPVRRAILERLEKEPATVGELASPLGISLQAVSRNIEVLLAAGLIARERAGRISRCSLTAGPILDASAWLSRYSHYWEAQFDGLKSALEELRKPQSPRRRSAKGGKK